MSQGIIIVIEVYFFYWPAGAIQIIHLIFEPFHSQSHGFVLVLLSLNAVKSVVVYRSRKQKRLTNYCEFGMKCIVQELFKGQMHFFRFICETNNYDILTSKE